MPSLLNKAVANVSNRISNMSSIPIPADVLKNYLNKQPAYVDNRERAAVVLDQGFKTYDAYIRAKPFLFFGSLITAGVSGFALYKRHKRGAEAVTLHTGTLIASLVVAFITRPGTTPKAPPGTTDTAGWDVVATLDKKRIAARAKDPQFADHVFARLAAMPGVKEQLAQAPLVKAAIF